MAEPKNPPAFPQSMTAGTDGSLSLSYEYADADGMTLLDWFAGKALGESTREIWSAHKPEDVAKRCYALAEAMINERDAMLRARESSHD